MSTHRRLCNSRRGPLASLRISVLEVCGEYCILAEVPLRDYKTVFWFVLQMTPLSPKKGYGHVVDNIGGAVNRHLPAAAGDGLPLSPAISEN